MFLFKSGGLCQNAEENSLEDCLHTDTTWTHIQYRDTHVAPPTLSSFFTSSKSFFVIMQKDKVSEKFSSSRVGVEDKRKMEKEKRLSCSSVINRYNMCASLP